MAIGQTQLAIDEIQFMIDWLLEMSENDHWSNPACNRGWRGGCMVDAWWPRPYI
jgi:hypothetical protein